MKAKYSAPVSEFVAADRELLINSLTPASTASHVRLRNDPSVVWGQIVDMLQDTLGQLGECSDWAQWHIYLSYPIPWSPEVIDAVLIARNLVITIEFRLGAKMYSKPDIWQVEDLCLKLRDFHLESNQRTLVPLLIATDAPDTATHHSKREDFVEQTFLANRERLVQILGYVVESYGRPQETAIDPQAWEDSDFDPIPDIVEVIRALYAGANIGNIPLPYAGAIDLHATLKFLQEEMAKAKAEKRKVVCFISGVPGSGKTFAGLNLAYQHERGVFLSANKSLLKISHQAISRDLRGKEAVRVTQSLQRASSLVEDLHRFLSRFYGGSLVPETNVIVVDDAQNAMPTKKFIRKYGRFSSEAEMILDVMDRRDDWAAVLVFLGCGENTSTNGAGLSEWGKALNKGFKHWRCLCSPYVAPGTGGQTIFPQAPTDLDYQEVDALHLSLCARAFRAEELTDFLSCVMTSDTETAKEILSDGLKEYPIFYTRSLDDAREWLRKKREGQARVGLIASSGAKRIKCHGIELTNSLDLENWLLRLDDDLRSSSFLESAATATKVYGLELDWACVCWGADLRHDSAGWQFKKLRGTTWSNEDKPLDQILTLNKYHILLSRAREGQVIWIPPGEENDSTRLPRYYDDTAEYLKACGIPELKL